MKIRYWLVLAMVPFGSRANAQLSLPLARSAPAISEVGPHDRVWRSVTIDQLGNTNVHSYTELATGLNFLNPDTGRYEPSQERFEITKDGHAVARFGQHRVILSGDVNTGGSVDMLTP